MNNNVPKNGKIVQKNSNKLTTNIINILDTISDNPSDEEIKRINIEIQRRLEIDRMNKYKKEVIEKKKLKK